MRIVVATAIALVVAIPLDLAIEAVARQAFVVSPDFPPFRGAVAPYTAGGIILAGVVYAVLRRFVGDADRVYVRLAIVALVLSWVPDVALLFINEPGAACPRWLRSCHACRRRAVVVTLLYGSRRAIVSSTASGPRRGRRFGLLDLH